MTAKKREGDTAKPRKIVCKEVNVVIEVPDAPTAGVTVPPPPETGKFHLVSVNGTIGWEPHE